MLVEVKVPMLSESVAEATLISWHKKTGDYVNRSENLIDVETDKVVLELPAPSAGVLTKILKKDGATVASGEVIAMIETEATDKPASTAEKQTETPAAKSIETISAEGDEQAVPLLMPAAHKLAEANNLKALEISTIKGTGLGGRVTKEDVQAYMENKSSAAVQTETKSDITVTLATPVPGTRAERRVAMSRLRQRVAERL
ncbi:MAG: biotin/lipoyl-containing protein, partial [Nitrosomonas sp.]|nr:biotin/lipoyl-containing protein [Nitrosomonas sp.]